MLAQVTFIVFVFAAVSSLTASVVGCFLPFKYAYPAYLISIGLVLLAAIDIAVAIYTGALK